MKRPESTKTVPESTRYILKLYVADNERNSLIARENLSRIYTEYLEDNCRVEEVDVLTDFTSALSDKVFVTPALVLVAPEPRATIIGNLGDKGRVISALRLRAVYGK